MSKDITQRLRDYANDYTSTTHHDDLINEAANEIESLCQQLAEAHELIRMIFESTPPYREDDTCVFSDKIIEKWKEICHE